MIRRPPRSTRTDTLFPYTTLFRSWPVSMPGTLNSGRLTCSVFTVPITQPPGPYRSEFLKARFLLVHLSCKRIKLPRSEEHTSELQSLMRISYAVFCLKKKKQYNTTKLTTSHTDIITS